MGFAYIGSVSHGTMRPEDLIPSFMDMLDTLKDDESLSDKPDVANYARLDEQLAKIERRQKRKNYYDSEAAQHDLEWLCDTLESFAPPYVYFGSHEGDGADFGFWVSHDSLEDARRDGEILTIDAGDEWPKDLGDCEYVLEVTDHGNMTLYTRQHKELWAVV